MADGGAGKPRGEDIVNDVLGEKPKKSPRPNRDLTTLRPAECGLDDDRPYVIKGLVARADHAQFLGAPGSGKSLLAPLAGYSIAQGIPFLGRRVRQGPVIYLSPEDGHGMKRRVRALFDRLGDAPDFILMPDPLDLMDSNSGDLERVLALIRAFEPVAVFLDTVARAFPGLRENDSDSMGRVVTVGRFITGEECKPALISLHHIAKDAGTTPRGHGILAGDLDLTLLIQGEQGAVRTATIGKNRNGPSDASFAFSIGVAHFPDDADGDPVTAPYAEPEERAPSNAKREKEAKLGDAPAIMLRELRSLVNDHGEITHLGADFPPVRAVTRHLLRTRLIDRGWFPDNLLGGAKDGGTRLADKGYAHENTSLAGLKRRNLASFNRHVVWLL